MFQVGNGTSSVATSNAFDVRADGRNIQQIQVLESQTQVLGAAGTIDSTRSYNKLNPAGNVSTSAATAITAGLQTGQIIVLQNISAFTVTIKQAALTNNPGALDFALTPNSTITYIFDGTNWTALNASGN